MNREALRTDILENINNRKGGESQKKYKGGGTDQNGKNQHGKMKKSGTKGTISTEGEKKKPGLPKKKITAHGGGML